MQSLKEKLHSAKGSSLLIVMVYFLLCLFVGGVVLTAATANGGRLAAMKADHQANYAQRSAAMVVQDELKDKTTSLVIDKITTTTRVTSTNGATTVSETVTYELKISGQDGASLLENIIQQAAAKVYLEQVLEEGARSTPPTFDKLMYVDTPVTTQDMLYGDTGVIVFTVGDMELTGTYSSNHVSDAQFGTFVIRFTGPKEGDDCQISLVIPASVDTRNESVGVTTSVDSDHNTRTDIRKQIERTTVTWSDPVIRKGAVE